MHLFMILSYPFLAKIASASLSISLAPTSLPQSPIVLNALVSKIGLTLLMKNL